jgi:hypothetical protein
METQSVLQALRLAWESAPSCSHFRQYSTPLNVQMMQMNVPHFLHG